MNHTQIYFGLYLLADFFITEDIKIQLDLLTDNLCH